MSELAKSDDYRHWIVSIKSRVQASQIKAAVSVNRELMELYWFLGEQIIEKQVAAQSVSYTHLTLPTIYSV